MDKKSFQPLKEWMLVLVDPYSNKAFVDKLTSQIAARYGYHPVCKSVTSSTSNLANIKGRFS